MQHMWKFHENLGFLWIFIDSVEILDCNGLEIS